MLELRPVCENCNKSLPPNSTEAMICSFECTFCQTCVDEILANVCPNCGGGFCKRPVRPRENLKDDNYLGKYPASSEILHRSIDVDEHKKFAANVKHIPSTKR